MFLGMDLPGLNLPSPQKTYAMMGFVVWHIGTEVLLEIHAYRLSRKGTQFEKSCCGAGEMVQGMRLLSKHEDLSSNLHVKSRA